MKQSFLFLATFAAAACVASADDVYSITAALDAGLSKQLEILQSMTDASSCAAAAPALEENLKSLAALNDRVDPTELWNHISCNAEIKEKLVHTIQSISIEYYRLEQANFFGCEQVQRLLMPLLAPSQPIEEP